MLKELFDLAKLHGIQIKFYYDDFFGRYVIWMDRGDNHAVRTLPPEVVESSAVDTDTSIWAAVYQTIKTLDNLNKKEN